jgi:hypothetical protein
MPAPARACYELFAGCCGNRTYVAEIIRSLNSLSLCVAWICDRSWSQFITRSSDRADEAPARRVRGPGIVPSMGGDNCNWDSPGSRRDLSNLTNSRMRPPDEPEEVSNSLLVESWLAQEA